MAEPGETIRTGWFRRLWRAALWLLFALVLLIPKSLSLRRRPRLWNVLRCSAAALGALLVWFWLKEGFAWPWAFAGIAVALAGLLVAPIHRRKTTGDRARERGALVVVNGGRYRRAQGPAPSAELLVAPDRVIALDSTGNTLVEIPFSGVNAIVVEQTPGGWTLRIESTAGVVEFAFDGFFAEHLARVAESTLRSQLHRELAVLR